MPKIAWNHTFIDGLRILCGPIRALLLCDVKKCLLRRHHWNIIIIFYKGLCIRVIKNMLRYALSRNDTE